MVFFSYPVGRRLKKAEKLKSDDKLGNCDNIATLSKLTGKKECFMMIV